MYVPTTPAPPSPTVISPAVAASNYSPAIDYIAGLAGAIYGFVGAKRPEDIGLAASDTTAALLALTPLGPAAAIQAQLNRGLQFWKDKVEAHHVKSKARKHMNLLGGILHSSLAEGHDPSVALARTLLRAKLSTVQQASLFPLTPFIGPVSEHVALPATAPVRDPRQREGRAPTSEVRAQRFSLVDPETGLPATADELLVKYGAAFHAGQQAELSSRPFLGRGLAPTFFTRTTKG